MGSSAVYVDMYVLVDGGFVSYFYKHAWFIPMTPYHLVPVCSQGCGNKACSSPGDICRSCGGSPRGSRSGDTTLGYPRCFRNKRKRGGVKLRACLGLTEQPGSLTKRGRHDGRPFK